MAADTWLVMILFSLGIMLAFIFLLWASRKGHEEEIREWQKEIDEWKKSHPVWYSLYMSPFPIGTIFTLVGPKFPKIQSIETENQGEIPPESENDEGYSPKNSILGGA